MALLELRDITKVYRLGGEEIRALDGVSLDIEEGEFKWCSYKLIFIDCNMPHMESYQTSDSIR